MSIQVGDLQYASPATVSRCGMVFVDPKNLGYKPYWERWMNALSSKGDRDEFIKLFDKYVPQCISLILEGVMDGRQGEKLKTILPVTNLNLVSSGETDIYLVGCGSMIGNPATDSGFNKPGLSCFLFINFCYNTPMYDFSSVLESHI